MINELPDDIRLPLHRLQADMKYLFARVALDPELRDIMADSVLESLSQLETACYEIAFASTAVPQRADWSSKPI